LKLQSRALGSRFKYSNGHGDPIRSNTLSPHFILLTRTPSTVRPARMTDTFLSLSEEEFARLIAQRQAARRTATTATATTATANDNNRSNAPVTMVAGSRNTINNHYYSPPPSQPPAAAASTKKEKARRGPAARGKVGIDEVFDEYVDPDQMRIFYGVQKRPPPYRRHLDPSDVARDNTTALIAMQPEAVTLPGYFDPQHSTFTHEKHKVSQCDQLDS
jgi:hypothetical protein